MDPATAKMAVQLAANLSRNRGLRHLLVGLVALALAANMALLFGPWMLTTQISATLRAQQQSLTDGGSCTPTQTVDAETGSAGSLSAEQVGYGKIIWQVGQQLGAGDRGAVVAIATALQESSLRNLAYGDRDSVGLFQQRAGWGSVAERMNPQKSAHLFYAALLKVPGWRGMTVSRAAQSVQRSAFPDAYAKHEKAATGLVALFKSKAPPGTAEAMTAIGSAMCGNAEAAQCPATGMPMEAGLTPDALRVLRCLKQQWPQLNNFGGIGDRTSNVDRDHQEGRAIDAMIPNYRTAAGQQLGQAIASWAVANHGRLGVHYVIWHARIWNTERAAEGWRDCGSQAGCYAGPDDTAAHRDHVHVSVFGDQAATPVPGAAAPVVRPVDQYVLTARFGECSSHWAHCHTGLDFSAGLGVPVRAIMGGRVTWTKWGGAYGNLTKVQHANGVESWYAHQSSRRVQVGDIVKPGQVIGAVGATGNTTGAHLHLEVRLDGSPVDPDRWLSARGVSP
jgi:hypothetical protein